VFLSDVRGNRASGSSVCSVTIGLEGAKNDQYGRGAWRTMHASGDRLLCPVKALQHVIRAKSAMGPAASASQYLCYNLTAASVDNALKTTAAAAKVPTSNYSTHSIRIGGATALLNGRVDGLSIKLLGRWMSHTYESYPVQAAAATIDLSSRMV
jgi:hypothetical protein